MYLSTYRPVKLSLGSLEQEIMKIAWELGTVTVKDIRSRILSDPDRELTAASISTVLNRLTQKGWLTCDNRRRSFSWQPLISESQAVAWLAYEKLHDFLTIGSPDTVADFAGSLDSASLAQIATIAQIIQDVRSY